MSVNNSRTDSTGGIYTGTHMVIKHFMVLDPKMDHATGDCTVTVIDANDEDPIPTIDTIYPRNSWRMQRL